MNDDEHDDEAIEVLDAGEVDLDDVYLYKTASGTIRVKKNRHVRLQMASTLFTRCVPPTRIAEALVSKYECTLRTANTDIKLMLASWQAEGRDLRPVRREQVARAALDVVARGMAGVSIKTVKVVTRFDLDGNVLGRTKTEQSVEGPQLAAVNTALMVLTRIYQLDEEQMDHIDVDTTTDRLDDVTSIIGRVKYKQAALARAQLYADAKDDGERN